ncbi:MAG: hypothetical protein AB8B57_09550 [Congregibacter sp.]
MPESPPATNYGATMYRKSDPRSAWQPYMAPSIDPPVPIDSLLAQVERLEQEAGPMSQALTEPLGWLSAAYLAENRLPTAIKYLTRGIHLTRINDGLFAPSQTEMLEQLISAHIRRGDFVAADDYQHYLYRVQSFHQRHAGNAKLQEATLRYADWMRGAYLGDIDPLRYPRLVGLNDLYVNAIDELVENQGHTSPELLPYLQGRVELSYLISVYPGEDTADFRAGAPRKTDYPMSVEAELRFWRLRDHNFRYGLEALQHTEEIVAADPESTPQDRAQARIARADWYQWHRRYAAAIRLYEEAWAIMEGEDGAAPWLQATLGTPLELPQGTVFNPGFVPLGTPNNAEVNVGFQVSRHGAATNIEILTEKIDDATQSAANRAYHYLRNMRFRPRLENGKVVASAPIQLAYQIRY